MLANLKAQHRDKLARLLREVPEFNQEEVAVALELIDAALNDPACGYHVIVDEEGDDVAGYVCFGATPMTEGCFDLYWLAVSNRYRTHGIGRKLVSALEKALCEKKARLVRVETSGTPEYEPARRFYEATGFGRAAQIRDFYWPGNDLYIFTKYFQA